MRRDRPFVCVCRRLKPRVLKHARLDAPSPQVVVGGIRLLEGGGDGNLVLAGVGDLLNTGHAPLACRRNDLEIGGERANGNIEPNLIIALAGAAMCDSRCTLLPRRFNHQTGNQGASERGGDGIDALVERVGLEGGKNELADELIADIGDVRADRAGVKGTLPYLLQVIDVAEIRRQRDDIVPIILLDPPHSDGRIQPPAIRKNKFVWH